MGLAYKPSDRYRSDIVELVLPEYLLVEFGYFVFEILYRLCSRNNT